MNIEKKLFDSDKSFYGFINSRFFKKQINLFFVTLVLFLAYGLKFTYVSYNNDNSYAVYSNFKGLFCQGRWGSVLSRCLLISERNVPMWSDVLGLILLVISATIFAYLWWIEYEYKLSNLSLLTYILVYISFPLSLSFYVYPTAILDTSIYYICVGCSMLILQYMMHNKVVITHFVIATFMSAIAISGYESHASVLLLSIFLLLLHYVLNNKITYKELLRKMCLPFMLFLSSLIVYFIVQKVSIGVYSMFTGYTIPDNTGADKMIVWFSDGNNNTDSSIQSKIIYLALSFLYDYVYNSLFNFGLFLFWICEIIILIIVLRQKNNKVNGLFLLFLILFSIFAISIVKGLPQPYRTCQAMPLFVAFCLMHLCNKYRKNRIILLIVCSALIFLQTKECSLFLSYDKQVSEKNIFFWQNVGLDIKKQDYYHGQNVIMVGEVDSSYFEKLPVKATMALPIFHCMPRQNNRLIWQGAGHIARESFLEQISRTMILLNGIGVKTIDIQERSDWEQKVIKSNQPSWPRDGYIKQYGDEIVVNLGFPEPETNSGMSNFINEWKKILSLEKNK